jgi:hypothetical protein
MLRTNLSTRPFYNERAVHVVIGIVAALLVALTAWNVYRVVTLSRANTQLSSRVNQDHAEAQQLRKMAADIRRKINQEELQLVVQSAREANGLIDQRTFSWTAFFNRIESTMPPDVMLTSVRPSVKDGVTRVELVVLGRRAEDVDEFIEKLEATGAFENILPSQTDYTDEGLRRVLIESLYTGDTPPEQAPEKPAAPAETPGPAAAPRKGATP